MEPHIRKTLYLGSVLSQDFSKFKNSVQLLNFSVSYQVYRQLLDFPRFVLVLVLIKSIGNSYSLDSKVLGAQVEGCDEGFLSRSCLIGLGSLSHDLRA